MHCFRTVFVNLFFVWNVFWVVVLFMSSFDKIDPTVPPSQLDDRIYSANIFSNRENSSTTSQKYHLFVDNFSIGQRLLILANNIFRTSSPVSATFLDTSHESTQNYHNYASYNTLSPSIPNANSHQQQKNEHTIGPYGHHQSGGISDMLSGSTVEEDDSTSSTVPANPHAVSDPHRDAEYRLIRDLLSGRLHGLTNGYDRNVRPTRYVNTKLNISFGVLLSQVMDLDEKNQILTTSCWLNENWLDAYLSWDPLNYGNVTVIRLPANTIWKPDILLYNNADATYYRNTIATNAMVDSSGNVSLLTTSIYKSACRIDVQYFPFDQQVCNLSFGSWTFETRQLDLTLPTTEGDLSQYMENTEWNLTSMKAIREEVIFSCCPNDPYTFVHIEITMRRRPLFYVFNLILPCILITGLALLGFYTPSESGEKVTLGITTLLSLTVFLMFVGESMPPTSDTLPLIGVYYGVTIIVVSIATSLTVLTLNMHHCGNHGRVVPRWLSTAVLGYLAPALLIRVDWSENLPNSPFFSFNSENNYYTAPGQQQQQFDGESGGESAVNGQQQQHATYGAIAADNGQDGYTIQTSRRSAYFACCRGGSARSNNKPSVATKAKLTGAAAAYNIEDVQHKRLDNGMLKNSGTVATTGFSVPGGQPPLLISGGGGGSRHRRHCHHQLHQHAYMHAATTDEDEEIVPNSIPTDALVDEAEAGGDQLIRRRRKRQHMQPQAANPSAASAVLRTLAYNEARFLLQERLDTIKTEWQLVAMVIDRALLIIFVISTFAVSSYILLRSPYMWN